MSVASRCRPSRLRWSKNCRRHAPRFRLLYPGHHATARIGETGNVGRRLSDHAADPAMAFAREVYVISGYQRAWFDKTAAIYLQYRLTGRAERAGLVDVIKGVNPQVLELPSQAGLPRSVRRAW